MASLSKRVSAFSLVLILCVLAGASTVWAATYRPDVVGTQGLVTSAHSLASLIGTDILKKGGNAVDAAVAVGFALNVVEPNTNSIGGNGMMTIYWSPNNEVFSLHMTGSAPEAVKPDEFTPQELDRGYNAGCVPGNYGGYLEALRRFGTMSLAEVVAPAIHYAENGFPVSAGLSATIGDNKTLFETFPTTAKVFLPGGKVPKAGELLIQNDLANTFKKIVAAEQTALRQGKSRDEAIQAAFDRFYKGDIAQEIVRFHEQNGGVLTAEDLAGFEPIWGEPVHTTYRGYDVYSNGSTSRGGIEVMMQLNLIEAFDLSKLKQNSAEALHLIAECIKLTKSDVYRYVGDPDFVDIPLEGLLSKEYAAERRKLIDLKKAMAYPQPGTPAAFQKAAYLPPALGDGPYVQAAGPDWKPDTGCTTSFSIVDREGNAVSCTPTIGSFFGTGVLEGRTGIFLNNGMRLGSVAPYADSANCLAGGKKGLLNNSPTIVLKDGKLVMAFGTPGGEGIGQTQFEVLLNVLDWGMSIQEAIEAPRFTFSAKPDFYVPGSPVTMGIERRVDPAVLKQLEAMGHTLRLYPDFTSSVGGMQGIVVNQATGTMMAGADPRRGGYAVGY